MKIRRASASVHHTRWPHAGRRSWRTLVLGLWLVNLLSLPGVGQSPPPDFDRSLRELTAAHRFDLPRWEIAAVTAKIADLVRNPAQRMSAAQQQALVRQYLDVAQDVARQEREIERVYSDPAQTDPDEATRQQRAVLEVERAWLAAQSGAVEAILEQQLARLAKAAGLTTAGIVWPPPRLRFTEPPQLLVLSPRDRIERLRSVDLVAGLDPAERNRLEQAAAQQLGVSAYVTRIGGYGAWPTMVVDRYGLSWTVETIAHEWVHNYLAFRPLGWANFKGGEGVTINETVASIVGEELGQALLALYYPDQLPLPQPSAPAPGNGKPPEPPPFDFNREMRATRQVVDRLLAHGYVEEAEAYMEARRQRFVANGYPLRVLNQAYFAFHGSYATSPAATDPIGPKLRELRRLSPSLAAFLRTVEGMSSAAEIDAALERLRSQDGPRQEAWQPQRQTLALEQLPG